MAFFVSPMVRVISGKRHHHDGRLVLGRWKLGDHGITDAEFMRRVDEQVGPSLLPASSSLLALTAVSTARMKLYQLHKHACWPVWPCSRSRLQSCLSSHTLHPFYVWTDPPLQWIGKCPGQRAGSPQQKSIPFNSSLFSSSGVKCNPAVGAATAPSCLA